MRDIIHLMFVAIAEKNIDIILMLEVVRPQMLGMLTTFLSGHTE